MKLPAHIHGLFDELKSLLPKAVFPAPGDTHHAYTQYDPDKFAPVITHVALPAGRVREIEAKFLELRRAIDEAPEPASAEDKHTFPFAINGKVVELPRRVVRAAEEVGVYMNERFDGPWAFCGIQKRVDAPPAVAAKEPEYSDAEIDATLRVLFGPQNRFSPEHTIHALRRGKVRAALRILHRNKPAPTGRADEIDRRNGKTPTLDSLRTLIEAQTRALPSSHVKYRELRLSKGFAEALVAEIKEIQRHAGGAE